MKYKITLTDTEDHSDHTFVENVPDDQEATEFASIFAVEQGKRDDRWYLVTNIERGD